jgi:hypothetical protein
MPWNPPGAVDDLMLAQLPFPTAQRLLAGAAVRGSRERVLAEWHGTSADGDTIQGSLAMVNPDGPLADLVGERIKVTFQTRSVIAYVHKSGQLDDDLSLTRTLFARLARLDATNISVLVEVVQ